MHQNYSPPITRSQSRKSSQHVTLNSLKRKPISEVANDGKKKKKTSQHVTLNSLKRKPISEVADDGKKKKKTVTASQGESSKSIICGICYESITDSNKFRNNGTCDHLFCNNCISKHVTTQINENNKVKVNCPFPECSIELELEHLKPILPNEVINRWETAICESSIDLMQKYYCPYENCSVLLVNDGEEIVTSSECPSCHRLFCAQCKVPWHVDMTCSEFQGSKDEKYLDSKFLELAKSKKWQNCPKCSFYVNRTSGCEHITCRCGSSFCYKCGKDWTHGHQCSTNNTDRAT